MFNDIPAWIFFLDTWDLAGMISHTMTFTLLESLVIFGLIIGAALLIPSGWIQGRDPAIALVLITIGLVFAFIAQNFIRDDRGGDLPVVLLILILITALALIPISKFPRLQSYAIR